jgi:hypothetical protein
VLEADDVEENERFLSRVLFVTINKSSRYFFEEASNSPVLSSFTSYSASQWRMVMASKSFTDSDKKCCKTKHGSDKIISFLALTIQW